MTQPIALDTQLCLFDADGWASWQRPLYLDVLGSNVDTNAVVACYQTIQQNFEPRRLVEAVQMRLSPVQRKTATRCMTVQYQCRGGDIGYGVMALQPNDALGRTAI